MVRIVLLFGLLLVLSSNAHGQWVQTNGPYGGDANSIVSNDNYVFAAAGERGIYRSSDHGQTWSQIRSGSLYDYYYQIFQAGSFICVLESSGFNSDLLVTT